MRTKQLLNELNELIDRMQVDANYVRNGPHGDEQAKYEGYVRLTDNSAKLRSIIERIKQEGVSESVPSQPSLL